MSTTFEELVAQLPPNIEADVEAAVKRWNRPIRELVRAEMGVRSREEDRTATINIEVTPGLPKSLMDATLSKFTPLMRQLSAHYDILFALVDSTEQMYGITRTSPLSDCIDLVSQSDERALTVVNELAQRLLGISVEGRSILAQLLAVEEDVLGSYHSGRRQVEVYWKVVGVFSHFFLHIPVDTLACVILTHELAHAYSHLGLDIDGDMWRGFQQSDLWVIEGIAQYYTARVAQRLTRQFPGMNVAYESLLKHQVGPYRVHEAWTELAPEIFRSALLEVRKRETGTDIHRFVEGLANGCIRLGQRLQSVELKRGLPHDIEALLKEFLSYATMYDLDTVYAIRREALHHGARAALRSGRPELIRNVFAKVPPGVIESDPDLSYMKLAAGKR